MNVGDGGAAATPPPARKAAAKKAPARKAPAKPAVKTVPIGHPTDAAAVVAQVAHQFGIPAEVALAIAQQESGLNPHSVGDNGTSFGLFQLHQGGELGSHSAQWAFDPYNNARQALSVVAHVHAQHPDWDWGTVAAAAQRPADQTGYAQSVNAILGNYQASGQHPLDYFKTAAGTANGGGIGTPPDQTVAQYLGNPDLAGQYGYLTAYMKQPGVGQLLATAAKEGWNQGEMLSALEGNKVNGQSFPQAAQWWKNTSQTAMQLDYLRRTQPATYKETFNTKHTQVADLATSMGIPINPARLSQLTTTALYSNWSDQQLKDAIAAEFHYNPKGALTGSAGAAINKFKQAAANYLVPVDDRTLQTWAQNTLAGKTSADDFTAYVAQQAKTLYPWMSHAIDAGIDPNTYLNPYRSAIAQTLELDPNSIDFMAPKYMRLVQTIDPKTGQRTENGLANALTTLRTDPQYGYGRTQQAIQQAAGFAQNLLHQFGYSANSTMSGVPDLSTANTPAA